MSGYQGLGGRSAGAAKTGRPTYEEIYAKRETLRKRMFILCILASSGVKTPIAVSRHTSTSVCAAAKNGAVIGYRAGSSCGLPLLCHCTGLALRCCIDKCRGDSCGETVCSERFEKYGIDEKSPGAVRCCHELSLVIAPCTSLALPCALAGTVAWTRYIAKDLDRPCCAPGQQSM